MCDISTLKNFRYHPKQREILQKVKTSLEYFPEVTEIKIGGFGRKGAEAVATAGYNDKSINFNILYNPSFVTIFHELGHHLQFKKLAPNGEKAASVFGLARVPEHLVDSNYIPYIGRVPNDKIKAFCNAAINERVRGRKQYIKWMEDEIEHQRKIHKWVLPDDSYKEIPDITYKTINGYICAEGFEE
jgi:hypothetical protein